MADKITFNVKEALDYAKKGLIEEWVHEFLTTAGKNPEFSVGLKLQKRYWAGPVVMGFDMMVRCCGPEESMEYRHDAYEFNRYVDEMVKSLNNGWEAPPLIVQYHEGRFTVNDGNHRYEALKKHGFNKYWVILWFNDQENFNRGIAELSLYLNKKEVET